MATHSAILASEIPWTEEWAMVHGVRRVGLNVSMTIINQKPKVCLSCEQDVGHTRESWYRAVINLA